MVGHYPMSSAKRQPKPANDPQLYAVQPIPFVFLARPDKKRRNNFIIAGVIVASVMIGLSLAVYAPKAVVVKASTNSHTAKQVEPFDIKLTSSEPASERIAEATENTFSAQESVGSKTSPAMEVTFGGNPQQEDTQRNAGGQDHLAQQALRQGHLKQALRFQHRAAELAPGNNFYRLKLAILYDRLGHRQGAAVLYQQVVLAYESHEDTLPSTVNIKEIKQRLDYLSDGNN